MQTPADILDESGPLAAAVDDYHARPQQVEMAESVAAALAGRESLVCEAGTGTGKTFAYLVPAILSGLKILISTGTKHLQDQLYNRDLPIVQKALRVPVNVQLLKGRANYLCRHRLRLLEADPAALDTESAARLADVHAWSQQTTTGDLAELRDLPEDARLIGGITSTTENCLGQACRDFDDCFVFEARRRAAQADITIVNHHLYLSDLALRERGYGELLPEADAVIFDEAHQLPELATQFFSRTISSHQWQELVRDCRAAYVEEAADMPEFLSLLDRLEKSVRDLRLAFGRGDRRSPWHEVREEAGVCSAVESVLNRGHDVHQLLEGFAQRGKLLDNAFRRLGDLLNQLDAFHEGDAGGDVQWLEVRGRGFLLHRTPLDVAAQFQARLGELHCPGIYTSATLSVNRDFTHFTSQLGLDGVETRSWDSPFDFQRQALLYLPGGLPDPRAEGFTERAVQAALPVLKLTRGRAFFLFTSHRALKLAVGLVRAGIDNPVLVQGEAPRTELLERFRSAGDAVLLGTSSFWEGVDVRGQALSCVIIDKLPFAAPDDPVLRARMQKLEEEGRNPFRDYQVPQAVIDLRQGIGRLIRDRDDYGLLVICDPRVRTRNYGPIFLRSLPQMVQTTDINDVAQFLAGHEGAAA